MPSPQSDALGLGKIFAFALPAIPFSAAYFATSAYLTPFYAEQMGLGLTLTGLIFMAMRFWDVVTDPTMGLVSDRVRVPLGKRRFWLLLSIPIMMVTVWALFLPGQTATSTYLVSWLLLFFVGYTMLGISHYSWAAELSPHYHERSRIMGMHQFLSIVALMMVMAAPAIMESQGASMRSRVNAVGLLIIISMPITVLICVLTNKERDFQRSETKLSFAASMKLIGQNKPFRRIIWGDVAASLYTVIPVTLMAFFSRDVLGRGDMLSTFLMVSFITAICSIPGYLWLSRKIGKHNALKLGMVTGAIGLCALYFGDRTFLPLIFFSYCAFGLGMAAILLVFKSLIADVVDLDTLHSGQQRTGTFFAIYLLINKAGGAIAVGVAYPLLAQFGYVPGHDNSLDALEALAFLYAIVPAACALLVALCMHGYSLTAEKHEEIRQALDAREKAAQGA